MGKKRVLTKPATEFNISIEECFEEFIAEKQARGLSKDTIRNYTLSYEVFTKYLGMDTTITDMQMIKEKDIYRFSNHIQEEGVSATSVNHYLRDLRAWLYWAMKEEYLEEFSIKEIKAMEAPLKFYTDEELSILLEKPARKDSFVEWRTWAIINWILGTGNRAASTTNVLIEDIDFHRKLIRLRHTKSKKSQNIPLSSSTETAIKEYIRMWRSKVPADSFLFPDIGEEQLTVNALRLAFSRYCKAREIEKTSIHGLRHTFARLWILNGGGEYQLQQILGHSSLAMTRRYVHLYGEDLTRDFDTFNPLDTLKKAKKRTKTVERS